MEYFFEIKKLTVGYDKKPVVENVRASVKKGEILCLIGPNGCGKSTVLKSISRQLEPLAGLVEIKGRSIRESSGREFSRQTAVVLTERPRPELMTCWDVAASGRYPYTGMLGILSAEDKAKVNEALDLVNALDLKDRDFTQVSDGQLQRIMLARAICQEPEMIVLDEPTSFLDIRYAIEILDVLQQMAAERQITVIMSLHELNYAKRISDQVMCIKDGAVIRLGRPEEVFREDLISDLYDLPPGIYQELFGEL